MCVVNNASELTRTMRSRSDPISNHQVHAYASTHDHEIQIKKEKKRHRFKAKHSRVHDNIDAVAGGVQQLGLGVSKGVDSG